MKLLEFILSIFPELIKRNTEKRQNNYNEFNNKGELYIDNDVHNKKNIPEIKILVSNNFKVEIDVNEDVKFIYSNKILDQNNYKFKTFYIKNIGKANINELRIAVSNTRHTMLVAMDELDIIVNNNLVNYEYTYDRKILTNEYVKLKLYYLKDEEINDFFSSNLVLVYKDSYGNYYEQAFFVSQNNLYEPIKITYEEYKKGVNKSTAIEYFKNPYLW